MVPPPGRREAAQLRVSPTGRHETSAGLTVDLYEDFEAAKAEWRELAAGSGNAFGTWEWASTWWRHLGDDRPLYLIACREPSGKLVAILPFYLASRLPFRVVRLVGRGPGDELGPVCAEADRSRIAPLIREGLDLTVPGWDVLVAENLPRDPTWAEIGDVTRLNTIPNPVIEFKDRGWDEYLASRSQKFRSQYRRDQRRLADHDLTFRLVNEDEDIEANVKALFDLHGNRWGDESSGVFVGREGDLQMDFAKLALEQGWLRLWFLDLDGKPAATRLGFRIGSVEGAYQAGRNTDWDKFGIGFLLMVHVVEAAANDGVEEFRLLRGGEAYKSRLTDVDLGLESIAVPRGIRGRAAILGSHLASSRAGGAISRLSGGR